jgi:hypothetical protein
MRTTGRTSAQLALDAFRRQHEIAQVRLDDEDVEPPSFHDGDARSSVLVQAVLVTAELALAKDYGG